MRRLAISVPNAALPTVVTCLKRCRAIPNRLISSSSTRRRWGISFCSTRPLQRTLCEPAAFHAERQSTLHSRLRAKTLSLLFANHHNASLMQAALSDVTTLTPCSHTSVRGSSRVRRKKARQIWWRRWYCYAFVAFASL
mgnify:CR=1 FL=1